jgi:hypothetical protein
LVHTIHGARDESDALQQVRERADELATSAVVEGLSSFAGERSASDRAEIVAYAPERVEVHVNTAEPALLVLKDSYYPGWHARVDGAPAKVYATDFLFRGVPVPAGEYRVVFEYRPTSWQRGLYWSAGGLLLWFGLLAVGGAIAVRSAPAHNRRRSQTLR